MRFMSNTRQYSFWYLVIRHQNPFTTITHFSTISYPTSTLTGDATSRVLKTQD